jgi:hypothetical protein
VVKIFLTVVKNILTAVTENIPVLDTAQLLLRPVDVTWLFPCVGAIYHVREGDRLDKMELQSPLDEVLKVSVSALKKCVPPAACFVPARNPSQGQLVLTIPPQGFKDSKIQIAMEEMIEGD